MIFYSVVELISGFSTSLTMGPVLRFRYGIGMGGEWGLSRTGSPIVRAGNRSAQSGFGGYPQNRVLSWWGPWRV